MDILNINLEKLKSFAIKAYIHVFGEEYKDIIKDRIKSLGWISYDNIEGVESYVDFLKKCKKKALAVKFLEKIGVDISKQKEKGFAEDFDKDITDLLKMYLGDTILFSYFEPGDLEAFTTGIRAWISKEDNERIKNEKIKFLNYIRDSNQNSITLENYDAYCKTEEYKKILKKIESYLKILYELIKEYEKYLKSLKKYEYYISMEKDRKKRIEEREKMKLYIQIEPSLPTDLRKLLDKKCESIQDKYDCLLCSEMGVKSSFEFFSIEDEEKLKNPNTEQFEKQIIIRNRIFFLQNKSGVDIQSLKEKFSTDEELYDYLMEQPEIRRLIPSNLVVSQISRLRREAYSKTKYNYVEERLGNHFTHNLAIINLLINNSVGIASIINNFTGIISLKLLFTVRDFDQGFIDETFLHEMCHTVETRITQGKGIYSSGFEENLNLFNPELTQMNPHSTRHRKYERFNENVTDTFSNEATQYLHSLGIYLIEPKEVCYRREKDSNTHIVIRNLLKPFIQKYRKSIVKARILGDYSDLFNSIGKENFEELNDVISILDLLYIKGASEKINKGQLDDPIVVEYLKQEKRLKDLYVKMENYQTKSIEEYAHEEEKG